MKNHCHKGCYHHSGIRLLISMTWERS